MRQLLRGDAGFSGATAVIFIIIVSIMGAALAAVAITITSAIANTSSISMMDASVTSRANDYVVEAASGGTASVAEICYPLTHSCVTVTEVNSDSIKLVATSTSNGLTITRTLPLSSGVTHISGFSDDGQPVWVNVPGHTKFPSQ